ncbi:MAG TPA: hypothetical protein VG265_11980, partial [Gaiellaceae bacterium]|nr:hypothetical protein [Gaiellaceae bacterium]
MAAVARVTEPLAEPVGATERHDAGGVRGKVRVLVLRRVISALELPGHTHQPPDQVFEVVLAKGRVPLPQPVAGHLPSERLDVEDRVRVLSADREDRGEKGHQAVSKTDEGLPAMFGSS